MTRESPEEERTTPVPRAPAEADRDRPELRPLMGADSDAYRDKMHEIQRRNAREVERTKKIRMPTPEQTEADALDLTVVCVKG